jgi:hypothetical protein
MSRVTPLYKAPSGKRKSQFVTSVVTNDNSIGGYSLTIGETRLSDAEYQWGRFGVQERHILSWSEPDPNDPTGTKLRIIGPLVIPMNTWDRPTNSTPRFMWYTEEGLISETLPKYH